MCDRQDLGAAIGEGLAGTEEPVGGVAENCGSEKGEFFQPTLYLYDAYPGGIGLSEPLYSLHDLLISRTKDLISGCSCEKGCPSCVGPAGVTGERAKEVALAVLEQLQSSVLSR
jgi:DEAD/DEAH box helicase domain-containing protein